MGTGGATVRVGASIGVAVMSVTGLFIGWRLHDGVVNALIGYGLLLLFGFAMIWHIWWLAIVGLVGAVVSFIVRSYDEDIDYYVQPEEIARIEQAHHQTKANAVVQA